MGEVLVFSVLFRKVSVDFDLRVIITYIKKTLVVANEICFLYYVAFHSCGIKRASRERRI